AMPARPPGRTATAVLLAAALLTVIPGVHDLNRGRDDMLESSTIERAKLGAVEIAGNSISPDYTVEVKEFPIAAAPYLGVVKRYGSSPADSPAELAAEPEGLREQADLVLTDGLKVSLEKSGLPPSLSRSCVARRGKAPELIRQVPRGGLWMQPER